MVSRTRSLPRFLFLLSLCFGTLLSTSTIDVAVYGNPQSNKITKEDFFLKLDQTSTLDFLTVEPGNYYSKDPLDKNPLHKPSLMSFIIIGTTSIQGQEKYTLAESFKAGIQNKKDQKAANCFKPRHALRFRDPAGSEYQSVICYECRKIWAIRIDKSGTSKKLVMFTTPDPQETFHEVAKRHGLTESD